MKIFESLSTTFEARSIFEAAGTIGLSLKLILACPNPLYTLDKF